MEMPIQLMTPAQRERAGVYVTGWDPAARNYYFDFTGPDAYERLSAWREKYPDHKVYKERGTKTTGTPGADDYNIRLFYSAANGYYSLNDKLADDNHFHKTKF